MLKYIEGKLTVGDIVYVGNPIRKMKYRFYKVNSIEGNKAKTNFRTFNRNIYVGKRIYEYGKCKNSGYNNTYLLSSEEEAKKYDAEIQ